jgi:hypothetical protein
VAGVTVVIVYVGCTGPVTLFIVVFLFLFLLLLLTFLVFVFINLTFPL